MKKNCEIAIQCIIIIIVCLAAMVAGYEVITRYFLDEDIMYMIMFIWTTVVIAGSGLIASKYILRDT